MVYLLLGRFEIEDAIQGGKVAVSIHCRSIDIGQGFVRGLGQVATVVGQLGKDKVRRVETPFHDDDGEDVAAFTIGHGCFRTETDQPLKVVQLHVGLEGVGKFSWLCIVILLL